MSIISALAALLVVPGGALGCNIAIRTIGPVQIVATEIKRPTERVASRARWRLGEDWHATNPELNQIIIVRGAQPIEGAAFTRQRALSIDAAAPDDNGWSFVDDTLEATPPCQLVGQGEWQPPVILVREGPREVAVTAVARRTIGDRTGCVLGGEGAVRACPTLTRRIVKLTRPLGARSLVFESVR